MTSFAGKVAVVTGGGVGIGRAAALAFAAKGAAVALTVNQSVAAGEATAEEIRANGGQARVYCVDVAQEDQVRALMDTVVGEFGRLDYAFNNAGVEGVQAPLADDTLDNFRWVVDTNLIGTFLCMKYELQHMLKLGGGAIVNMSSVAGVVGFPFVPGYTATKHAINGLTKSAALAYAKNNIRINAISAGGVNTAMVDRLSFNSPDIRAQFDALHPIGRMGEPDEVAHAAVWLCSPESSFVTGHVMLVDGGLTTQ